MTLMVLVPLVTLPYLSRVFNPESIGRVDWVRSVVSILISFASLGVYNYGIREGVKVKDSKESFSRLVHEITISNITMCILCYAVLFFLVFYNEKFRHESVFFYIYSTSIFFSVLGVDWVFGVYEDYVFITIRQVLVQIVNIVLLLLFVKKETDLLLYLVIQTLVVCIPNFFSFMYSRRYVDYKYIGEYQIAKHIPALGIFLFTKLGGDLYYYIDSSMLGVLSSLYQVGLYGVAIKMTNILLIFFSAMSPVILPKLISSLRVKADFERIVKKDFSLKTLLLLPCCAGLFFLSPSIINVVCGPNYLGGISTLRILAIVLLVTVVATSMQNDILIPKEQEKFVLILTIINIITNVGCNVYFIAKFGAEGAAYGSLISSAIVFFLGLLYIHRKLGINMLRILIVSSWKYMVGTAFCTLLCLPFYQQTVGVLKLCLIIVGFMVIYAGILFCLRDKIFFECIDFGLNMIRKIRRKR